METKLKCIINDILNELDRANELHPWPSDIIHSAGIVCEESGELIQASLNHIYQGCSKDEIKKEAIHVAATAIRFLINIDY
jgi:hypothetical protein